MKLVRDPFWGEVELTIPGETVVNQTLAGYLGPEPFPVWFEFETKFPHLVVRQWFRENRHLSIYIGIVYIAATFLGRKLMEKRQKFELRPLLFIWNVVMALYSAFLVARLSGFVLRRVLRHSFYGVICDASTEAVVQVIMWMDIFAATKVVEFIDTLFIILRKQHLVFIHWYHHATVVVVCWFAIGSTRGPPNCVHYVLMNSIVHSVMYTYYSLKVLRINVPRFVNITVTSMQISQMFGGLLLNVAAIYYMFLKDGRPCDDEPLQIFVATSVYLSYFFLFCHFFYKTYICRPSKEDETTPSATKLKTKKKD